MGYVSGGGFTLDTAKAGNRNTGHLFESPATGPSGGRAQSGPSCRPPTAKRSIEYLKTL